MHTCWWPDAQAVGTLAAGQERIEQVLVHLCGQAGAHLGATLLGRTQASQGGNIFSSQGAMPSTAQQHPGAAAGASVATGSSPSTAAAADDQLLEDFLEELVSSKHIKRDVTAFWEAWDQGKINVNGKLLQLPVPWRQLELCFRSQVPCRIATTNGGARKERLSSTNGAIFSLCVRRPLRQHQSLKLSTTCSRR